MPDRVPMVIWDNKVPDAVMEEKLLSLGLCVIAKSSVWRTTYQDVKISRDVVEKDGVSIKRTTFSTEVGPLTTTEWLTTGTTWVMSYPFSSPDDYDGVEALISSRRYEKDFHGFLQRDRAYNGQGIARPMTIHSPLHEIIYEIMGIELFSTEYSENRSRIHQLCDVLQKDWLRRIELVADSPAEFVAIEGNIEIDVIGPERFRTYYLPNIHRACEILHARDICVGAHLDGHNRRLAPLIAETSLDFIESFTPPPDCDLSIHEAREIWPDKSLQIHFPSSLHLCGEDAIRTGAANMLKEAAPGAGFIMGTSEDVPHGGVDTLPLLFEAVGECGSLPLKT
jgi:hypothetical protein